MDTQVIWAGRYTHEEIYDQCLVSSWLFLNMRGMRSCVWRAPDGREVYKADHPGPFLFMGVPGTQFQFSYGPDRENWVCEWTGPAVRQGRDGVDLCDNGSWVNVAQCVALTVRTAQRWAVEMARIHAAKQSPLPSNALRARLALAGIIAFMLDARIVPQTRTPAQLLRHAIDEDEGCAKSLEELSVECGYSSDHLRMLFQQELHVSPRQYRMQRRMARAMDLVVGSGMTVKEIAAHLGFPYVTHFSTAFRKAYGYPPSQAARMRQTLRDLRPQSKGF